MTINEYAATTTTTLSSPNEYLLLRCDVHGTKVCTDFESAKRYVGLMRACAAEWGNREHQRWHYVQEHHCWVDGDCCTIDPYGMFD